MPAFTPTMLACLILVAFGGAQANNNKAQSKDIIVYFVTTTVDEVNTEIAKEIAGHIPAQRIGGLEAVLGPLYKTLPKNAGGRVGHNAVRYALHRLFVKRHGWYIKGLEPNKVGFSLSDASWIPSYLQDKIEEHVGRHGMNLHELASLGAALEDLIQNEAGKRMKDAYQVLELQTTELVDMTSALDALDLYAMTYLLTNKARNGPNGSITGPRGASKVMRMFAARSPNFAKFHAWFEVVEQQHLNVTSTTDTVDFSTMTRAAEDFGERYGMFNDVACRSLKAALLTVEGKGPGVGRVKLSDFYNMTRYSKWNFTEKAEYLRDLGALDDTNSSNLMVIVPNYITSRPNCLEATAFYVVCCRDECEDLIGRLEHELKEPKAAAHKISSLIATYASDTVEAPRQLSVTLLRHLEDIASLHGGEVDVHSRLFAQWMHHAFPRECPYPHETGTTNPQTADEWMKANGHESEHASDEDMQKVLDGACSASDEGDLPWNPAEELMDDQGPPQAMHPLVGIFLTITGLSGLLIVWYIGLSEGASKHQNKALAFKIFSVFLLAAGSIAGDFVDKRLVVASCMLGLVIHAARKYMPRPEKELHKCWMAQDKLV